MAKVNNTIPELTKAQGLNPEEIWLVVLKMRPVRCVVGLPSVALASCVLSIAKQTAQVFVQFFEHKSGILHKKTHLITLVYIMRTIFRGNEQNFAFCFVNLFLKKGMVYSAFAQAGYFPSK